jgi:hypothetical protein
MVTWAGLASAALVQPGIGWLTVVATLTASAIAWQVLRVVLLGGSRRAAAAGWLLFAIGYLTIARGPWLGQTIGPRLISSQALHYAQVNWRKEDPSAQQAAYQQLQVWNDLTGRIVDGTSSTIWFDVNSYAYKLTSPTPAQAPVVNYFQLSGHWLCAWLAGWLGAAVATHYERRRHQATPLQPASCTMPLAAASAPRKKTAPP